MPEESSSRVAAQANQLYWQTSRPAGRLADDLGISRSKFYALIEPLSVGIACTNCGADLAFSNRSEREAGRGRCTGCGATQSVPAERVQARIRTADPPATELEAVTRPLYRLPGNSELWLSALAGLTLGLVIAGLWRRH
ncbi:MAG: hypothetical protein PVI01_18245 [Gemmatimonadales bacterium]|jgi:hypothetical protein